MLLPLGLQGVPEVRGKGVVVCYVIAFSSLTKISFFIYLACRCVTLTFSTLSGT